VQENVTNRSAVFIKFSSRLHNAGSYFCSLTSQCSLGGNILPIQILTSELAPNDARVTAILAITWHSPLGGLFLHFLSQTADLLTELLLLLSWIQMTEILLLWLGGLKDRWETPSYWQDVMCGGSGWDAASRTRQATNERSLDKSCVNSASHREHNDLSRGLSVTR